MVFIRIAGITGQERGKNFEKAITNYLHKRGYKINLKEPRRSRSGYEVDFNGTLEKTPVTVECKAHKGKIDVPLIAAFFGKYAIKRRKDNRYIGKFFSLSPLTDDAKNFIESIQESEENIPFEVITADELINNLIEVQDLEADYTKAEREFEKLVKEYNNVLNYNGYIEDKENKIFLEYLNKSYYWICIVSSIKGNHFLILDKKAEIPKDHKSLADQLRETENVLKDVRYLLAEKAELNSEMLLQAIIYCERNNEWKHVFKNTIELLSNKGYVDILSELFENPTVRTTVSKNDIIRKIEDISEKLLYGIENWKEECYIAQHCSQLLNFVYEYNIKNNEDSAVENLKTQIKIQSQILVFDKNKRTDCLEKISEYIDMLTKIDKEKLNKCFYFKFAYNSSKEALNRLDTELKKQMVVRYEENEDRYSSEYAASDYYNPDLYLIELYESQIKLLENAKDEENVSWADKEISELTTEINYLRSQIEAEAEPESQ